MTGSAVAQTDTVYLRDAHIGASASRENITSREGWLYFETDTGDIYYDNDGSGWSSLGDGTVGSGLTVIDSEQSTYSTEGSSVVYVDTSSTGIGDRITLTIDAASEVNGTPLEIYDVGESADTNPIRIENSSGGFVTELDVDRAYAELIYQDTRWLIKTSNGEGIWRTESDPQADITIPDSVVSRADDDDSGSTTNRRGLQITMKESFGAIGARISNNTSGVTRAYLYDVSAGQYIDDTDITGDTFTLEGDLQAGQSYNIVCDAEGSSFTPGFADSSHTGYSYEGTEFDIVNGVENESTGLNPEVVDDIGNTGF